MHRIVRQVKEEWLLLILLDELHGALRVAAGEGVVLRGFDAFDDVMVFHQRQRRLCGPHDARFGHDCGLASSRFALGQRLVRTALGPFRRRPHVIRIRDAEVMFKSLISRQELRLVTEMPFADAGRCIPTRLEHLRHRDRIWVQPNRCRREQHSRNRQHPLRIAPRHHRRTRGRANRCGIMTHQLHPLLRHAVEVRRGDFSPKGTDVGVAEVVDVDEDDIRRGRKGRMQNTE